MDNKAELIAKAKREKWYRSDLSFKFHKAQKAINLTYNQIKNQLFVSNCSRQFGKTYWAVVKAVECALSKPNAQIRYAAAFQSDLMDFIIPAFEKVMEDAPKELKGIYKTQGTKFVFPNGSVVKLVGLDKNPNGLRGNTLDLIIIDECGFVGNLDYVYKSIIIPATTHRPDAKIILISTPPSTPAHSFVDYCQKAEAEDAYKMFTVFENPMLEAKDVLRLMKETGCTIPSNCDPIEILNNIIQTKEIVFPADWKLSTTFRREYLCEFILDDDLALIKDWKDEFIAPAPKDDFYPYYHRYVGMDLGRKDHTALIFGYYDFKKATLFIEDELTMNGPSWTTVTLKDEILAKEAQIWGEIKPFRRVSDNNNPHLIMDLNSLHNVHFMETNKESLEAMVNEVRIMVGNGQVIIDPKCKMLIGCLKYGIWDKNRREFARNKIYGHFDHLAALIYLVRNLAKHTNPVPLTHGHESHRSWKKNLSNQNKTHNANVISNALIPKKPKLY